jgi:putative copper resistance protein D
MSDQSPWQLLDATDLRAALWQTQFGQLWIWRAGIGVALAAALCFVSRNSVVGQPLPSRSYQFVLVTGIVLLVTLAWAGHAASGIHYYALHLGADMVHLLIGAIWPLGLIPMGGFLWDLHKGNRLVLLEREVDALHSFSKTSLFAVLVLIATGIVNGWLMIGSWNALATTTYGQLLLVKVAVVGLMIGLGGFNRFYLLPRIQVKPTSLRILSRTIFAESGLAAVVLLIVGTMGMTAPPS